MVYVAEFVSCLPDFCWITCDAFIRFLKYCSLKLRRVLFSYDPTTGTRNQLFVNLNSFVPFFQMHVYFFFLFLLFYLSYLINLLLLISFVLFGEPLENQGRLEKRENLICSPRVEKTCKTKSHGPYFS